MAQSVSIEDFIKEKFSCGICLELFTMPLTLPCGHNFCQHCIHEIWDREEEIMAPVTCPVCRMAFDKRPEPKKNVNISAVVEQLREVENRIPLASSRRLEKETSGSDAICPRHNRKVTLFCRTEKRCICCECIVKGCKDHHQVELMEDERQKEKNRLCDVLRIHTCNEEKIEGDIVKMNQLVQNIQDSCKMMSLGISLQFDELRKVVEECCTLAIESLKNDENAAVGQALTNRDLLQRHLEQLQRHHREAQQLFDNPDDVAFLQGLSRLVPAGPAPVLADVPLCGTSQVDAVTKILPEANKLLKDKLASALFPVMPPAQNKEFRGSTSPARPIAGQRQEALVVSELRANLFKDYRNLAFDPNSANKYIHLSHQDSKATHKRRISEKAVCDLKQRFQTWQVSCTEGFSEGHHYWELEISNFFVIVGVAYGYLKHAYKEENIIGRNLFSWSLQVLSTRHSAWHNNHEHRLQAPKYSRIGISLDFEAGNLTFYGVKDNALDLIHSFTCNFTDKLYPVFWIGESTSVTLCQNQDGPANFEPKNLSVDSIYTDMS
ncbi:E3 ubiquitin-protein ligase TRIM65 [Pelodytes ibericus]